MPPDDQEEQWWEWIGDPVMGPRHCSRCQQLEGQPHKDDCPGAKGVPSSNE